MKNDFSVIIVSGLIDNPWFVADLSPKQYDRRTSQIWIICAIRDNESKLW